jgi:two-component system nitrate/nitrite response regulator NarL
LNETSRYYDDWAWCRAIAAGGECNEAGGRDKGLVAVKRIVPVPTIIVEERPLLREGVTALLQNTTYNVLASVASISEIPDLKCPSGPPLLAILGLQDELDATLQSVRRLREIVLQGKIVAIGERHGCLDVDEILNAGVDGIIFNVVSGDALVKAFDLTLLGQQVVILDPTARHKYVREEATLLVPADRVASTAIRSATDTGSGSTNNNETSALGLTTHLSDREQQVLICVARGESNKTIARACSISEATVKAHIKAILRKIAVRNRTQAALWAIENGLSSGPHFVRNLAEHAAANLPPRIDHLSGHAKLAVRPVSAGYQTSLNGR